MTKPTAWMPMYWGDYLRDTGHLSTHQHGAYLLLIAHYWSTGKALPDDDARLSIITRVPPHLWRAVRTVISPFFKVENGHWYHPRIERELIVAFDNKEAAVRRGKSGAASRWGHRASIDQAIVKHSSSPSPPPIKNHESDLTISTGAARDPAPDQTAPGRAPKHRPTLEQLAKAARARLLKGEP